MDYTKFTIHLDQYTDNNALAVIVKDQNGGIYGRLSVNDPLVELEPNEFLAKVYSENERWAEHLLKTSNFESLGVVYTKHFPSHSVEFPIYRVTPELISSLFEQTYNPRTDIYEAPPFLFDLHADYCE